jgi:hypothetical protein
VEWGLENRAYNSGTSLTLDSDSMTVVSGAQTTRSGAYDPNATGNNVIRASTVTQSPIAVCSILAQAHIGTFRVWARCYVARQSQRVRLAWRAADNRYIANDWVTPPITVAGWCEMDLGTMTIPTVLAGTQTWDGRIDAYETDGTVTPGALDVDYLRLSPAGEGYGRARGTFVYNPGLVVAYDQFTGATGTLGGRTATLGGSWVSTLNGSGTTDLAGTGSAYFSTAQGGSSNSRRNVLGTTNYTNTEVSVDIGVSRAPVAADGPSGAAWVTQGVIARWVDSTNNATAELMRSSGYAGAGIAPSVTLLITASGTTIASVALPLSLALTVRLRLLVYTSGLAICQLLDTTTGALLGMCNGVSTLLATGGTLATGKPGVIDTNFQFTTPPTRTYDNFTAATPDAFPPVLNSGQALQFRHDGTIRSSSGGTYGEPEYRGSRFLVPPGTSRVAVAARRYDLAANLADNVTDSTSVQVGVRTRGLVVPRA